MLFNRNTIKTKNKLSQNELTLEEYEYKNFKSLAEKLEMHYKEQNQQLIHKILQVIDEKLEVEKTKQLQEAHKNLDSKDYKKFKISLEESYQRQKKHRENEVSRMYAHNDKFIKSLFKLNARKEDKGRKQIELDDMRINKLEEKQQSQSKLQPDSKAKTHIEEDLYRMKDIYNKAYRRLTQKAVINKGRRRTKKRQRRRRHS